MIKTKSLVDSYGNFIFLVILFLFTSICEGREQITVEKHKKFLLGDFSYVIEEMFATDRVGEGLAAQYVAENSLFLVIIYEIENTTKESKTVIEDDFVLYDTDQRKFKVHKKASTALALSPGVSKSFMFSRLSPGIAKKMYAVFEVPIKTIYEPYQLIIPQKRWGSKEGLFKFQFPKPKGAKK